MSTVSALHTPHPSRVYIETLQQIGMEQAISNVSTTLDILTIDGVPVPTTLNQGEYHNSYVCSPYTAYISYAKDELSLIQSKWQRLLFKAAIGVADGFLKLARINQTLSINNWLVSTNLPNQNWTEESLQDLTTHLIQRYPNHSFHMRSLNRVHHANIMDTLKQEGWLLLPARQVYLFDNGERNWWKRSHTKRDQNLLRKTALIEVPPEAHQKEDFEDIHRCFHQLFIEKHSEYNPQFSARYLYEMHRNGIVSFFSFRDPESGRILASIGLLTQQDIITSPIVGYDTNQPQQLGLYRLLMAVLLRETYTSGKQMNLSSGASQFKQARGGQPEIEYTAFYVSHLPCHRQWILQAFAFLLNQFGPKVLQSNQV